MQLHTDFVLSTGGTLALDKCKFYFVEFAFNKLGNSYILPMSKSPGELIINNDFASTSTKIKRLEATEPHRTLGYYISPDGNFNKQVQILKDLAKNGLMELQYLIYEDIKSS